MGTLASPDVVENFPESNLSCWSSLVSYPAFHASHTDLLTRGGAT